MGVTAIPPERPLIIWHPGDMPPDGYIKAYGAILSRDVYAWLFSKIGTFHGAGDGETTFGTPDLRGEFLRGLDDGRGVDAGRVLGSFQASQNLSHTHNYLKSTGTTQRDIGSVTCLTPSYSATATTSEGGDESRPRNVAGLYCIAYAP